MSFSADNLTTSRPTTMVAALSAAVGSAEGKDSRKLIAQPTEAQVEREAETAISAKAVLGATQAPAMGLAAEAIRSAKKADAIQLTADTLKLTSETVAKATPAASSLNAGGQILSGLNKAAQGDAFGAASAASAAAEKIAPALAKSGVGAIASAVILGTGDAKLGEQARELGKSAKKVVSQQTSAPQRAKAALDVIINLQSLAVLGRSLAAAAVNVGRYGVRLVGKVGALAPVAESITGVAGTVARSPVGRAFGFLNKWIPLLNVAGVAFSAKTAVDVFRTAGASTTTRVLSVASLFTAGAALWAGFALPGLGFLGIVLGSIGLDLVLASARKRDAATGDMDAQTARWMSHPGEAGADLAAWLGEAVPAIGRKVVALGKQARERLFGGEPPASLNPRRSLT